ncbi:SIMPL domain-containing protein [Gallalistipes aquisgranensis]|uniref:SIMPL domain-containing protein n=1 Tax=Gallalistipes aquisgranensis TaxID=2779358 RepID=UPI001CF8D425|nr:SIMPL domain-containing protein [Gallalistipes aquisgranensis]MBE5033515.1 SIMPL domain-containing protein [Gallalistipes aquisgranensis]
MKRLLFMAAALMLCSGLAAQNGNNTPYIETSATASREVTPDEIFVRIVLSENDTKGKISIDKLQGDMMRAIKKAGIDFEKSLTIDNIESQYQTYLLRKSDGRTTKTFLLMVGGEQLAPLFTALDEAGISNVNIQSARYSKVAALRDELRVEAAKAAQARARMLAQAVGQEIGKAMQIQNYDNGNAVVYNNIMLARASAKMADGITFEESAPTVEFKKIKVESTVTIRFSLPQ